MYKILPILLFSFIFSQYRNTNLFSAPEIQAFQTFLTEKQDTNYLPTSYFEYIEYNKLVIEEEINIRVNGLVTDMFFVKTELEIIDTAYCNNNSICVPDKYSYLVKADSTYTENRDKTINSSDRENGEACLYDCEGYQEFKAASFDDSLEIKEICEIFNSSGLAIDNNECFDDCGAEFKVDLKQLLTTCDCPSQTWNEYDNCVGKILSLDEEFRGKSNQSCSDCEYNYQNYGSECCDKAWDEYGIQCSELEMWYNWDCSGCNCLGDEVLNDNNWQECDAGYVDDCSGDGDCCPASWVGDGFADCEDQAYGCDLSCYNFDGGACPFSLKPEILRKYFDEGKYFDLIYDKVFRTSNNYAPISSEYGIIIGEIKVEVLYDEKIKLGYYKGNIVDLINSTHPSLPNCKSCISFASVDMDSLIGVNEEVKNTITLNRNDIYDDSWAVIIGIDKYKYSDQLNYAVNDAEAVKEMLISKFDYPEENIRYLTDEQATLPDIKLALDDISTTAGENDRILVFYSGHGETIKGVDGTEKGYIIPYEGRQNKAYATGLAMDEILTTSMLSQSKHMLFLMDACYSGLMTENVKGVSKPEEQGYLSKVANEKARQIITAGGRDEQVIERDEWQHSAFTKNLLEGLDTWGADYNKDGCITADELSTYLRENVTEDSDFQQTPQDGRFRNSGGGEFVFFGSGNSESGNIEKLLDDNTENQADDNKLPFISSLSKNNLRFQVNFQGHVSSEMDSETSYIIGLELPLDNSIIDKLMIGYTWYIEFGTSYNYNARGVSIEADRMLNDNLVVFSRLNINSEMYLYNNISNKSINISPQVGLGYPTRYVTLFIGLGRTFSDLKDESGLLLNNGFYTELGLLFHVP